MTVLIYLFLVGNYDYSFSELAILRLHLFALFTHSKKNKCTKSICLQ